MSFKELALRLINEGYEEGGRLIEMGEYDPMYPEAPQEEAPVVSPVSLDSALLKELLLWAGAEEATAQNVVTKAVELSQSGPLTVDHLMDLTGAADYEQPTDGCPSQSAGVVSPVVPSGPMSPVMASYQRRAKAVLEGVDMKSYVTDGQDTISSNRNKGNHGLNVKKIKEMIASIDENDEDGLYKAIDDIQNPESDFWNKLPKERDMEENEEESLEDEISDIDAAGDTLEGAVDGAVEAVQDAAPGALDDVDPSILDGDRDGETVEQQIAAVKAKIDTIAAELGIETSDIEDFEDEEDEDAEFGGETEEGFEDEEDEESEIEDFEDEEDEESEIEDFEDEEDEEDEDAEFGGETEEGFEDEEDEELA